MSSTIADSACVRAALLLLTVLCAAAGVRAEECSTGRGLTSNDIVWLSGNDDTLWMITRRTGGLALNYIAGSSAIADPSRESNWWSYTLGCKNGAVNDLASGGGISVMSLDTLPNTLWTYEYATDRIRQFSLPWPPGDTTRQFTVNDIVYSGKRFFFACLDGGLVAWDPESDAKTVFVPGRRRGYDLPSLSVDSLPKPLAANRVVGVEVARKDSLLVVVTPARVWRFSPADSSWDSSIAPIGAGAGMEASVFGYVFVNRLDRSMPVYSIIDDTGSDGATTSSRLVKYSRAAGRWDVMFDQAPKALSFGTNGYFYTLFDEQRPGSTLRNIIRLYRDTLGDSGCLKNQPPVVTDDRFHARMTREQDIDVPSDINDVLFVPRSANSGYLWIATSEGLFFCNNEIPGAAASDSSSFVLIKRAPPLAAGLKKTYARPGIITPAVSGCKFIYNVSKSNTKVTIRVYDFNMDLVKTVIENRTRQPGNMGGPLGRSTVESEDNWDGTNGRGRPVAPGVYYYKITTSTGERSFGKIVVAR
jgi:hypothetical protein